MADSRTCEVGVSVSSVVVTEFGKYATSVNVKLPQRKVTELCTMVQLFFEPTMTNMATALGFKVTSFPRALSKSLALYGVSQQERKI